MKIAEIKILEYLTEKQKQAEIQNSDGKLIVEFVDAKTEETTSVNVAQIFKENNTEIASKLMDVFKLGDYELNKRNVFLKVEKTKNEFNLSASRIIGINNEEENISNCDYTLMVNAPTGNLEPPFIKSIRFTVNVNQLITQEEKQKFTNINLTLEGDRWDSFKINGKSLIKFEKSNLETVFKGVDSNGFKTE